MRNRRWLVIVVVPRIVLKCGLHGVILRHAEVLSAHFMGVKQALSSLEKPTRGVVHDLSADNSAAAFSEHQSASSFEGCIHTPRLPHWILNIKPSITLPVRKASHDSIVHRFGLNFRHQKVDALNINLLKVFLLEQTLPVQSKRPGDTYAQRGESYGDRLLILLEVLRLRLVELFHLFRGLEKFDLELRQSKNKLHLC